TGGSGKTNTLAVPIHVGFDDNAASICDTITGTITVQIVTAQEPFAATVQPTPAFGQFNHDYKYTLAQGYTVNITGSLTYTVPSGARLGLANNPVHIALQFADSPCDLEIQPPSSSGTVPVSKSCPESTMYGIAGEAIVQILIYVGGDTPILSGENYIVTFTY